MKLVEDIFDEEDIEFVTATREEERKFIEKNKKDFSDAIIGRGENYYNIGAVENVKKIGARYYSVVHGQDEYNVEIINKKDDGIIASCTCPCYYPCKHIYATLIKIVKEEYKEINILPIVKRKEINVLEMLKTIPADNLKEFIITSYALGDTKIDTEAISHAFPKFAPKQSYEYYYNSLYNKYAFEEEIIYLVDKFIQEAKEYLEQEEFYEVFKIIKAIIAIYVDTDVLKKEYNHIENFYTLGMFLRIAYRKGDKKLKKEINCWKDVIQKNNYYKNYYLEDMLILLQQEICKN